MVCCRSNGCRRPGFSPTSRPNAVLHHLECGHRADIYEEQFGDTPLSP